MSRVEDEDQNKELRAPLVTSLSPSWSRNSNARASNSPAWHMEKDIEGTDLITVSAKDWWARLEHACPRGPNHNATKVYCGMQPRVSVRTIRASIGRSRHSHKARTDEEFTFHQIAITGS